MADKKKMTVAEILAAARKADGGDQGPASGEAEKAPSANKGADQGAAGQDADPVAESPSPSPSASAPAKIAKPGSSGRPDVSSILAMARSGKGDAASHVPSSPEPAAKADPPKASPVKSAQGAAKSEKPSKGSAAAPPRDTASILAAARKKDKSGPLSKSEAAARASEAPSKGKLAAPPIPTKPAYAERPGAPTSPRASSPKSAGAKKGGAQVGESDDRRGFLMAGFAQLGGVTLLWTAALVKFMFPNVLREPPSKFKVGFPDAFPAGQVETKYKAQFGIWIINTEYNGRQELFALKTVCTHLGCTPNWLEAEQKFKCPCHGSGFYKDGINFEGPAPRPLERYAIRIADDGQIEIDKSRTFQEEMGQWADASCYIPV